MLQKILAGGIVLFAGLSGTGVLSAVLARDEKNNSVLSRASLRRTLQRSGWAAVGLVIIAAVFCSALAITSVDIELGVGIILLFFSLRYLTAGNLNQISEIITTAAIVFLAASNGAVITLLSIALTMSIFYLIHKRSRVIVEKVNLEKIVMFSTALNILFCLYAAHLIREALQQI